tara:strand:+ start:10876 stop:11355 length:480 start_codon:yes stop_codon:yes gene_type:complete
MSAFNRVILVGNLTRDVELKTIPSGTSVCEIGLAVNEKEKRGEEWVEVATFVDITLWGRTAEVAAEYLSKGASVLVEGRLKLDTWEQEGNKRSKLRVVGEKLQMLGGKSGGGQQQQQSSSLGTPAPYPSQQQQQSNQQAPSQRVQQEIPGANASDDIPF